MPTSQENANKDKFKPHPKVPRDHLDAQSGYLLADEERRAIIALLSQPDAPSFLLPDQAYPVPHDHILHGKKVPAHLFILKDSNANIIALDEAAMLGKGAFGAVLVGQMLHSSDPNNNLAAGQFCAVKRQVLKPDATPKQLMEMRSNVTRLEQEGAKPELIEKARKNLQEALSLERKVSDIKKENKISGIVGLNFGEMQRTLDETTIHYYSVMPLLRGKELALQVESYIGYEPPQTKKAVTKKPTEKSQQTPGSAERKVSQTNADTMVEKADAGTMVEKADAGTMVEKADAGTMVEKADAGTMVEKADAGTMVEKADAGTMVEKADVGTMVEKADAGTMVEKADKPKVESVKVKKNLPDFMKLFLNEEGKEALIAKEDTRLSPTPTSFELDVSSTANVSNINRWLDMNIILSSKLEEIHAKGILHCDIKPENIMYDPESELYTFIDYGISKFQNEKLPAPTIVERKLYDGDSIITRKENLRKDGKDVDFPVPYYNPQGTGAYLAPEFFDASYIEPYSNKQDLYALGRMIEMLMYKEILQIAALQEDKPEQAPFREKRVANPILEYTDKHTYLQNFIFKNAANDPQIEAYNALLNVIRQATAADPATRPEAHQIKEQLQAIRAKLTERLTTETKIVDSLKSMHFRGSDKIQLLEAKLAIEKYNQQQISHWQAQPIHNRDQRPASLKIPGDQELLRLIGQAKKEQAKAKTQAEPQKNNEGAIIAIAPELPQELAVPKAPPLVINQFAAVSARAKQTSPEIAPTHKATHHIPPAKDLPPIPAPKESAPIHKATHHVPPAKDLPPIPAPKESAPIHKATHHVPPAKPLPPIPAIKESASAHKATRHIPPAKALPPLPATKPERGQTPLNSTVVDSDKLAVLILLQAFRGQLIAYRDKKTELIAKQEKNKVTNLLPRFKKVDQQKKLALSKELLQEIDNLQKVCQNDGSLKAEWINQQIQDISQRGLTKNTELHAGKFASLKESRLHRICTQIRDDAIKFHPGQKKDASMRNN